MRRWYAVLTVALMLPIALFVVQAWRARQPSLPRVEVPAELAGRSCSEGLEKARALTSADAFEPARLAYLWLVERCDDSPLLPEVLLEAGSLFGHLMGRPEEARRVYEMFLRRFPTHASAADASYHLARLDLDAGDYTSAVAALTALADRDPTGTHAESVSLLAARAASMLAQDQHSQRSAAGRLAALVPNNLASLLMLLLAIGPVAIQTLRPERAAALSGQRWIVPALVIGLTLLNTVINNLDNAQRDALVMERLDRLLDARSQVPPSR